MAYSEKVIDHYENPRNVGTLDKSASDVGTGIVGTPACGDVMKLQIQVHEGVIVDARFKTYGCGSAIASSSLVTEWVKGLTIDEGERISNSQIAEELCLPPVKIHCSVLAEDAIKAAIADYRRKKLLSGVKTRRFGRLRGKMTILELQDELQTHFTCDIRGVTIQEFTSNGSVFWEVTYRIFPKALGLSEWDVTTSVWETRKEAIQEAIRDAPIVAIDYGVARNPIPR